MDIEKGLEEERKNLLVYRHDFSPLGLSLLDVLCDIVRITKNNKFNGVDVLDITNHIFNYYYDNQAKIVDKEYLNTYLTLDIDITPYESYFTFEGDRASDDFKIFRSIFAEAIISELVLSDVIRAYQVGKKLERREIAVVKDIPYIPISYGEKEYMFGEGLMGIGPYLDNFMHVYEIDNEYFSANLIYDALNTKAKFNIGFLTYVALADRYMEDKMQPIINILQLLVDSYENTSTLESRQAIKSLR